MAESKTETITLPSGLQVQVQMPDLFAILASVGRVPNPIMTAVLDLLVKDGAYPAQGPDSDVYLRKRDEIRGMYAIASLCMVAPRLVLSGTPADGDLTPRDLGYNDIEALYWGYFRGKRPAFGLAHAVDVNGLASSASDGNDLPPATE